MGVCPEQAQPECKYANNQCPEQGSQDRAAAAKEGDASYHHGGNAFDVDYLTGVKAAARLTGRELGPCRKPLPPVPGPARQAMRMALAKLPYNAPINDRMVWRDWQEERDWLIQSYVRK